MAAANQRIPGPIRVQSGSIYTAEMIVHGVRERNPELKILTLNSTEKILVAYFNAQWKKVLKWGRGVLWQPDFIRSFVVTEGMKFDKPAHKNTNFATAAEVAGFPVILEDNSLVYETIKYQGSRRRSYEKKLNKEALKSCRDMAKKMVALYERLCQVEFQMIKKVAKPWFGKRGCGAYRDLRSHYYRKGVTIPYAYVNDINFEFKFLDCEIDSGVHPQFAKVLRTVESILKRQGKFKEVSDRVKRWLKAQKDVFGHGTKIGGFNPRFQDAAKKFISNHAFGCAIDIAHTSNPHVKAATAKAMDAILDQLEKKGSGNSDRIRMRLSGRSGKDSFARLSQLSILIRDFVVKYWAQYFEVSDHFAQTTMKTMDLHRKHPTPQTSNSSRTGLLEKKLNLEIAENLGNERFPDFLRRHHPELFLLHELIQSVGGVRGGVTGRPWFIQQIGVVSLPAELFAAMKTAGAISGIDYKSHKDSMHFEIHPPNQDAASIPMNFSTERMR